MAVRRPPWWGDTVEIERLAAFLILASYGLLLYTYAGYPALLWLLGRLLPAGRTSSREPSRWPAVSVVLSAYNEEAVIEARIRNLLEQDYPADHLEILVGSDGSVDRTNEVVERCGARRVQLLRFAERRGKASVLNDLMALARGEIVVFTDANTCFHRDAVRELVRALWRHPSACAVVGQLELRSPAPGGNLDGAYWRYETWVKTLESRFGSVLGANGAIYAFRRERYRQIPSGAIVDDFLAPLLMRLHGGGQIFFAPTARAWEASPSRVRDEFRRRVRIGAGDLQALRWTWPLLLPWRGTPALAYVSHKVFRWLGPWLLLIGLTANLWLTRVPLFRLMLAGQLTCYGLALLAPRLRAVPGVGAAASGLRYFLVLNAALLLGHLRLARGAARPFWSTTPRHTGAENSPSHQRVAEDPSTGQRVGMLEDAD